MPECIELNIENEIAELWLNRPHALNALSAQLVGEVNDALAEVEKARPRAFILAGRGERAFCAGADIKEFKPVATTVEARARHYSRNIFDRIEKLPMPTIAAVHGYTLGGGLELALCCDMRIAAEDARFGFPETGLGTFPGAGGTQRTPRLIGRSQAMWMIFTGERLDASEALRVGLVNKVVSTDALMEEVYKIARMISANAPLGVQYSKEAIVRGEKVPLEEGIRIETDLNMFMDTTDDYAEAARAFVEKRKPVFTGR
ncbi:enoyl-CoA hydratase/isomerase family protein [Rhizobium sp. SYY.PMSO]|uniref:enoyl-CoA hydratase/isomerase family protein n=1 Tax=Rhizobium sp. SYY.PMSO TaxID=3382192 RepID=UPI00398FE82B